MTSLEWAVVIMSFMASASAFYKGVYLFGIGSIRGKLFILVALGFLSQAVWIYFSYNGIFWIVSRALMTLGTLMYMKPFLSITLKVFSKLKWLLIFSTWATLSAMAFILAGGFSDVWISATVFVLDSVDLFVSLWGIMAFWPHETSRRWIGGSVAAAFLLLADAIFMRGLMPVSLAMIILYSFLIAVLSLWKI